LGRSVGTLAEAAPNYPTRIVDHPVERRKALARSSAARGAPYAE
jgi:hypothetical protein